jgi:hypothetical protein
VLKERRLTSCHVCHRRLYISDQLSTIDIEGDAEFFAIINGKKYKLVEVEE